MPRLITRFGPLKNCTSRILGQTQMKRQPILFVNVLTYQYILIHTHTYAVYRCISQILQFRYDETWSSNRTRHKTRALKKKIFRPFCTLLNPIKNALGITMSQRPSHWSTPSCRWRFVGQPSASPIQCPGDSEVKNGVKIPKTAKNQWEFQDPKMEVPTIYKAYVMGYTPRIWPCMVQYLHFRILEIPLKEYRFDVRKG